MKKHSSGQKYQALFGQALKKIRVENNLSQEELAMKCDLDRTYIGSVERGERNLSLLNIVRIAKALGKKPEIFFIGSQYD